MSSFTKQTKAKYNMENSSAKRKIILTNGAALAWIAVLLQLYLIIVNRTDAVPATIVRFFSFFTVLSNILVALCFTYLLVSPGSKWGRFFALPTTQTAVTLYIAVTGITYNVILRALWKPQGLQLVVNELLHSVIPVLFVLYWLFFVPKQTLKWKNIFPWMIFPAVYCVYVLIRGAVISEYPYPFMNAGELGYNRVLINIIAMILLFVILSLILVGIGKINNKEIARKMV